MRLRFDPERPIYQQIIDEFKRAIARGELAPGDRIPSQRDLAMEARINPNTVQRAYREMEWLGLTETLRGQGTFVAQAPKLLRDLRDDMAREALARFIAEMSALGFTAEAMVAMVQEAVTSMASEGSATEHLPKGTVGLVGEDGKGNGNVRNEGGVDEPVDGVTDA